MGCTVEKLLEIARGELGYKEKASNAQLEEQTANAGSKNYTKYARDLHQAGYYNGNKNGYAWCDVFVDWCFWMACGQDRAEAEKRTCQIGRLGAGVKYSAGYYKNLNRFTSKNPQPGYQIFFGKGEVWTHTGIVERIEGQKIYTIEGNVSNGVGRCVRLLSDASIKGYGIPFFEEAPSGKPEYAREKSPELAGDYVTTAKNGQNLRAGAGEDKAILGVMPLGTRVRCWGYHTGAWLYVMELRGGRVGFAHQSLLKKEEGHE